MFNIENNCSTCTHEGVCKYKSDFQEFIGNSVNEDLEYPQFFQYTVSCLKYIESVPTPRTTPCSATWSHED